MKKEIVMEEKSRIKDDSYIVLQAFMVKRLGLSGFDLIAYALIYGFTQDGEQEYSGSLQYLMEWLTVSKPTAIAVLKRLVDAGLLLRREETIRGTKFVYYKAVYDEWCGKIPHKAEPKCDVSPALPVVKNLYRGDSDPVKTAVEQGKIDTYTPVKTAEVGGKTAFPNNLSNNLENKLDDIEKETPKKKTEPISKEPIIQRLWDMGYIDDTEIPAYEGVFARVSKYPRATVEKVCHAFIDNLKPEDMDRGFPYFDNFIKEHLE